MKQKTKETAETSTREQALAWWNQWSLTIKDQYSEKHFKMRPAFSLTGREIEEIWRKETQNSIDKPQSKEIKKALEIKYNQKQYKQFDESLFKAYISKFSDEDKLKAFICILNELSTEIQFNAFLATLRKMKLDPQTESNIMTLVALRDI